MAFKDTGPMPVGLIQPRSFDPNHLASVFQVDPSVFQGQYMNLMDAARWITGQGMQPGTAPKNTGGQLGLGLNNDLQELEKALLGDRRQMQSIADEQYDKRVTEHEQGMGQAEQAIHDAASRIRETGQSSADSLQASADKSQAGVREKTDLAEQLAARNTKLAEGQQEEYQAKVDRFLGRTEKDFERARATVETDTAVAIQNRRKAVELGFGRQLADLEARGLGMTSTEYQQAVGQYTQAMGDVAGQAYESAMQAHAAVDMQMAQTMSGMRSGAMQMLAGSDAQTDAVRSAETQTMLNVASILSTSDQMAQQTRAAAESMRLQAEVTASTLAANGMSELASLNNSFWAATSPTYVGLASIISQLLAMKQSLKGTQA